MCGIAGARDEWLRQRGLDPARAMANVVAALRWRGADGAGVVRIGGWWLGCARLAITQQHSTQPAQRRGGRFAAVLNGAITNARELWAELLPRAQRRSEPPNDVWLPLLAVERGRRDLLAAMRGHHAFAVVDAASDELVLAQDRFGEKPCCCVAARGEATQAFASTPAALAAFGLTTQLPPRRVAQWFRFGFAPLPTLDTGSLDTGSNPDANLRVIQAPPSAALPHTAANDLRTALQQSVARCVDTAVPVGLLLSGGVDSSCLAACLAALGRTNVPAFQFCADGEPDDERQLAALVAARCNLPLQRVDAGPEVLDELPKLTAMAGMPLGDPSVLAVHAVAKAAAPHGVRVLLGGEGADELFGGYRRYRALATLPRWRPKLLTSWLRRAVPQLGQGHLSRWLRAATAADPALALLAVTPPAFAQLVLAPDLAKRRVFHDRGRLPGDDGERGDKFGHERSQRADLAGYLRWDLLPKVDVATMAAGVESRCPFLEGDLVALPTSRSDLGKRGLRRAFAEVLPTAVWAQPKRGFALPLNRWFRGDLPCLDQLAEPRSRQRQHLRAGGLARVIDLHRNGRVELGHGLYLLLAYELFLRGREAVSGKSKGPA